MPLLTAVLVVAFPVHGGSINSAHLIRVNSREGGGHRVGVMKSFGRGGGLESYDWKQNAGQFLEMGKIVFRRIRSFWIFGV